MLSFGWQVGIKLLKQCNKTTSTFWSMGEASRCRPVTSTSLVRKSRGDSSFNSFKGLVLWRSLLYTQRSYRRPSYSVFVTVSTRNDEMWRTCHEFQRSTFSWRVPRLSTTSSPGGSCHTSLWKFWGLFYKAHLSSCQACIERLESDSLENRDFRYLKP